jgi:hypothetical protein
LKKEQSWRTHTLSDFKLSTKQQWWRQWNMGWGCSPSGKVLA